MLKNTHPIFVKYYPPTNKRAAKIGLRSYRFKELVFIPFSYEEESCPYTIDKAEHWLAMRGYILSGMAELGDKGYVVVTDTFESLKLSNKDRIKDRAKTWFAGLSTTDKNRITIELNTDLIVRAYKQHIFDEASKL